MNNIINWIESHASSEYILMFLIIGLVVLVASVFMIRACFKHERETGIEAYSLVKIIAVALSPFVFSLLAVLGVNVSEIIFAIIGGIICVAVLVWNVLSFGIFYGVMFSVIHIVGGLLAGLSAAGFIVVGVAVAIIAFFTAGTSSSTAASQSTPEYVLDVQTNQRFYVSYYSDGRMVLPERDYTVLRSGDYAGRYIDLQGRTYITSGI